MASEQDHQCVICSKIADKVKDKILVCVGVCKSVLHLSCSTYKPSEIKFLEANSVNIKWYCDACSTAKKQNEDTATIATLAAKMNEIGEQIKVMMTQVKQNNTNIINNTRNICNMEKTVSENRTSSRPKTRSVTITESTRNESKSNSGNKMLSVTTEAVDDNEGRVENPTNKIPTKTIQMDRKPESQKIKDKEGERPDDSAARNDNNTNTLNTEKEMESWTKVVAKKKRQRVITGTDRNVECGFTSAAVQLHLFVNKVNLETTEEHIKFFIKSKLPSIDTTVQQWKIQNQNHKAFKVSTELKPDVEKILLDSSFWPQYVKINKFRFFRAPTASRRNDRTETSKGIDFH